MAPLSPVCRCGDYILQKICSRCRPLFLCASDNLGGDILSSVWRTCQHTQRDAEGLKRAKGVLIYNFTHLKRWTWMKKNNMNEAARFFCCQAFWWMFQTTHDDEVTKKNSTTQDNKKEPLLNCKRLMIAWWLCGQAAPGLTQSAEMPPRGKFAYLRSDLCS